MNLVKLLCERMSNDCSHGFETGLQRLDVKTQDVVIGSPPMPVEATIDERAYGQALRWPIALPDETEFVSIHAHCDDFVVARFAEVELVPNPRADRGDERADLIVLQHLVEPRLLHVQDFPAEREYGLVLAASTLLRGPACARPLHDEKLRLRGVPLLAVRELPRAGEPLAEAFPPREFARLPRRFSGLRREDRLSDADLSDLRGLVEEIRELLIHDRFDDPLHVGVPELHLRLAFELGLLHLEAQDRGEAFPGIVSFEALALFHVLVVLRIFDEGARETGLEPGEGRAPLDRVGVVH